MPSGLDRFRTQHGEATLHWSFGRPTAVENALLPDGSRGSVEVVDRESRRLKLSDGTVVRGVVKAERDDIRVVMLPANRSRLLKDDCERFFAIVSVDAAFMAELGEKRFAAALDSVISNQSLIRGEEWFDFGERSGPELIAELRGVGESYRDFAYGMAGSYEPTDRERVLSHLSRFGFRQAKATDLTELYYQQFPEHRPKDDE